MFSIGTNNHAILESLKTYIIKFDKFKSMYVVDFVTKRELDGIRESGVDVYVYKLFTDAKKACKRRNADLILEKQKEVDFFAKKINSYLKRLRKSDIN
jgi:hypothetical protein